MANAPGKIGRQKLAAPGNNLPISRQIPRNIGRCARLTMFGTAVAWDVTKAAADPVRA